MWKTGCAGACVDDCGLGPGTGLAAISLAQAKTNGRRSEVHMMFEAFVNCGKGQQIENWLTRGGREMTVRSMTVRFLKTKFNKTVKLDQTINEGMRENMNIY